MTEERYVRERGLEQIVTVEDYEALARERLRKSDELA
jgi:hypothetical protein